jgi:thiamine biosynthesis lipoprotein
MTADHRARSVSESGSVSPVALHGKAFRVGHVMGMPISIDIRDAGAHEDPDSTEHLLDECFAILRRTDDTFSLWRSDTPMARLSDRRAGLAEMPVDVVEVLRRCVQAASMTGGLFTARRPGRQVDPTGLVKGWAVDRVARMLTAAGLRHWCINAAGDVLMHGQARPGEGWTVGIVDPFQSGRLIDTVTVTVGAVATSGTTQRGTHIWDPARGRPARGVRAATVMARDIIEADVLATAAVVRGRGAASWLQTFAGVEGLVVSDDGSVETTAGWPA